MVVDVQDEIDELGDEFHGGTSGSDFETGPRGGPRAGRNHTVPGAERATSRAGREDG